ncbi:CaiB/BaiF CoA transferase family protein [Serratia entomophila]|uniref:CoA transferase n=1 Tax=Serratia entomophila TaxID=42906 RepID=A0ABY5CYR8_9GAMM|nr:CaiB/BaiF CoA-transferase family protein [Serratia entomophila]USV02720.1 CoA transferase [Serratia entomophila]CAI0971885.1 Formyl-coenzyme A transferase [Serratia entomophila]CAI0999750.1 Formyl-coenzyme A transferase [Serratia entomophila]CAI1032465.1 Formyl-coenzyme A transferase [Serratia entomophila]CAI1094829.1 Formyl-coenzyme A transferase [Serratia entomophila]
MNLIQSHLSRAKPLEGMLIVSIEQALAAPLCTSRLAEMGARVIKIERYEGDFARGYDQAVKGESSYFLWTNHGKESMVLDFKQADDAALLEAMLAKADVFVQNLAPGALARAGFDSESLRRRYAHLITCDITGYGENGAVSALKAYDLLVQCESGLAGISGAPEGAGRIGVSICDIGAGMNAAIGVLSAIVLRERTGQGSGISVSLFDGAADWMTVPYLHEVYGQGAPTRQGLKHPSIAPYGAYTTSDGKDIVISIQNQREWQQFCETFLEQTRIAADTRFISNSERVRHRAALDEIISQTFASLPMDRAIQRLAQANIAFGQVRSVAEMAHHPALRKWPMAVGAEDIEMVAPPVRAPWDEERFKRAPTLGEHTLRLRQEFLAASVKIQKEK